MEDKLDLENLTITVHGPRVENIMWESGNRCGEEQSQLYQTLAFAMRSAVPAKARGGFSITCASCDVVHDCHAVVRRRQNKPPFLLPSPPPKNAMEWTKR